MHNTRYIIVPTNEVIDDMRNASSIEVNSSHGKTVFSYRINKPSCFSSYDDYSMEEWYDICQNKEKNYWGYPDIDLG